MRISLITTCLFFITACSGTMQTASISEAYKKYESQQYEETLKLISRAENAKKMTPETIAELVFLKAKTYEKLGQPNTAMILYQYLIEQHKGSQYSYLASKHFEAMRVN